LHEECGIVGVSFKEETSAALSIYYALFALQHRGQESAGITVKFGAFNEDNFRVWVLFNPFKLG